VAALYKWVDEDGTVTYSESLPPGKKGTQMEIAPAPTPSPPSTDRSGNHQGVPPQRNDRQSSDGQQRDVSAPPIDPERVKRCVKLKYTIATLKYSGAVYVDAHGDFHSQVSGHSIRDKGERTYISDRDRPSLLKKMEEENHEFCDPIRDAVTKQDQIEAQESAKEACRQAKFYLAEMKKREAHTTSDDLAKIEKNVRFTCRGEQ